MDALSAIGRFFAPAVLVVSILVALFIIFLGVYGIYFNATNQGNPPKSESERTKGLGISIFALIFGILLLPLSVTVYRGTLSDKRVAAYYGFLDILNFKV